MSSAPAGARAVVHGSMPPARLAPRPRASLAAALLLSLLASGCARCGAPKAGPPPERYLAPDAAVAVVIPSLERLSTQAADLLAAAATFPGGARLLDGRALAGVRLGFDPFDPASVRATGVDVRRGAGFSSTAPPADEPPDVLAALPLADASAFEAFVERLARDRAGATVKATSPGPAPIVTWRAVEGGPVLVAYAIARGEGETALLSVGPAAPARVQAALAVPADGHLGTTAAYRTATAALGSGDGLQLFVRPGTPGLAAAPRLAGGFAVGVRGGRDRLQVTGALLLGAREPAARAALAAARGRSAALLAKLDPAALLVTRGDGDLASAAWRDELEQVLAGERLSPSARELIRDGVASLGAGSAFGFGLVARGPRAGEGAPGLRDAPLAWLRAELLLSLQDPARARDVLGRAAASVPAGQPVERGEGRLALPLAGGELAVAVDGDRLAVVAGPRGALAALLARSGSAFPGPTPASGRALAGETGGLLLDGGRTAAALRAVPPVAWGDDLVGSAWRANAERVAAFAERIAAVTASGALAPGAEVVELSVELKPAAP